MHTKPLLWTQFDVEGMDGYVWTQQFKACSKFHKKTYILYESWLVITSKYCETANFTFGEELQILEKITILCLKLIYILLLESKIFIEKQYRRKGR